MSSLLKSIGRFAGLLFLAAGLVACEARIAPLSAQVGSSILIPFQGEYTLAAGDQDHLGYGGRDVADPQRGELVYHLDSNTGFPLVTVGSSRVNIDGGPAGQLVSLVEIPTNAPLGTHDIYVRHERFNPATGNTDEEAGPPYSGQLQILPQSVTVNLPGGGTQSILGSPTPLEFFYGGAWQPLSNLIQNAAPPTELRVNLTSSTAIWAVQVAVILPTSIAKVVGVRDPRPISPASTWLKDEDLGVAHRYTGSATASQFAIKTLAFQFTLVDPSTALLDPTSNVIAIVNNAWDKNGNRITATVSSVSVF